MDALKRSLAGAPKPQDKAKKGRKRVAEQGEMLLPIAGKAPAKAAKPTVRSTGRRAG